MGTNGKPKQPDISSGAQTLDQINQNPNRAIAREPFLGASAINPSFAFSALWNLVSRTYPTRSDEATRTSWQDALAARRDSFIFELLRARQLPVAQLPFAIDVDDPDDPEQAEVADCLTHLVNRIPNLQQLKLNLLEALWYGKNAVQVTYDHVIYKKKRYLGISSFSDVQGDKLVYRWEDDTWGVLVHRNFLPAGGTIIATDRGSALLLDSPYWRDRFIIHSHERSDSDYQFESQLGGRQVGVGLRDRGWFVYTLRLEILSWLTDSLQRLGANGMLIGKYELGNDSAMKAMVEGLRILSRDNVVALPVNPEWKDVTGIDHIEPAGVAYDVLFQALTYCDDILRRLFLGQNLSSESSPTGLGSSVGDLQKATMQSILLFDANNLSQTLTDQLLGPLIRYNYGGELDFHVALRLELDTKDVKERLESAQILHSMGVSLSAEDLRELGGFRHPEPDEETVGGEQPDLQQPEAK